MRIASRYPACCRRRAAGLVQLGKNLRHVHISDTDRLPPGQGRGDFVALVAGLQEIDFDGYLTMEIGFHRRDIEPDKVAREAYEYMKPLLAAVETQ